MGGSCATPHDGRVVVHPWTQRRGVPGGEAPVGRRTAQHLPRPRRPRLASGLSSHLEVIEKGKPFPASSLIPPLTSVQDRPIGARVIGAIPPPALKWPFESLYSLKLSRAPGDHVSPGCGFGPQKNIIFLSQKLLEGGTPDPPPSI